MWIDTFPAFVDFWDLAKGRCLNDQIEKWANVYLSPWPELLAKQTEDYASQNVDWREIARDKIFPFLEQRLEKMNQAHTNLLALCGTTFLDAKRILQFEVEAIFVIHVGIGCGAGWVTTFQDSPAILLGLENIVENDWQETDSLKGLLTHEIGHLLHYHWRSQCGNELKDSAWTRLFDEGFAQYCEGLLSQAGQFHQDASGRSDDWLMWCESHKAWLAAEFLRVVHANESASKFFGSWFEIEGQSETGYFLGYEVIRNLSQKGMALKEIAALDPEEVAEPILRGMI